MEDDLLLNKGICLTRAITDNGMQSFRIQAVTRHQYASRHRRVG